MQGSLGVWDPSAQAELEQSVQCALTTLTDIFDLFKKKKEGMIEKIPSNLLRNRQKTNHTNKTKKV